MSILKIMIVEDEHITAMGIQEQLLDFGYVAPFIASSSDEAVSLFKKNKPDLVLMDIMLAGSRMDGIELAAAFNNIAKVPIIYLTAYSSSNIFQRAKKTEPASYLIKPCSAKQLEVAIDLAIDTFSSRTDDENDYMYVKNEMAYSKRILPSRAVFHRSKGLLEIVPIDKVVYCLSDGDVTRVFVKNEAPDNLVSFTAGHILGFYNKRLNENLGFVRISDQILLNVAYIKTYLHSTHEIKLTNGQSMTASRRGGKCLKDYLNAENSVDTEGE
jgi:two-component system, response regulator PdtaR